jgi:hypothetical protein
MTVSSSTNRISYNGNGATTVFAYTFKIFDQDDLTVIIRSAAGTETVKIITSDYTVSGVGNDGGGNVTMLVAPAAGETITILRVQGLVQELDLVPNDPFPAILLEDALDRLTFMVQQHDEELARTIKASRTNTIGSTEFTVSASDRANKIFAFDSTGELSVTQELGIFRGNWATATAFAERDIVKDTTTNNIFIALVAHTSTGALPITTNADAAKWALLVDAASATSSASAASASAIAAAASEVNAAASEVAAGVSEVNAAASEAAAAISEANAAASEAAAALSFQDFEIRYLGAKSTDPTVDNDGNALIDGALYFDTANNVLKVYDLGTTAWQRTTPTSGDQANINTVTGIAADVTTVAGISSDVTTVAGISADVTAVVADATDIGVVAADLAGADTIGTVAGNIANVNTVAGIDADVTAVAGDATNIGIVATNITNVNTVAGISANVTTVAGISADVTAVAADEADIGIVSTNIANVNTVAGISGNVTTVAGISADVTAVAADEADIGVVATNIASVNTVATNISDVNNVSTNMATVTDAAGSLTTIQTAMLQMATAFTNSQTRYITAVAFA